MNEWYYACGGKQSGPVAFEALIELAKNGSLDPVKDLVWTSTMKDWLPSGQVPGIFRPISAPVTPVTDPSNPYAPPVASGVDFVPGLTGEEMPEIILGSQPLPPTACMKRAFDLVMRNFGMILLIGIVYIAVSAAAGILLAGVESAFHLSPARTFVTHGSEMTFQNQFTAGAARQPSLLHSILTNLLSLFLSLGLTRIGLNLVSGKEISVGQLFSGGPKFGTAIVASILYVIMVILGCLLLIFPGIYLALRFGQFLTAIVDRNLGVFDSFKYSASITTNNKINLVLLGLLMCLVFLAGFLALVVGLIIAIPVAWLSWLVAYRWMQYGYVVALDLPGTQTPMLSGTP